MPVDAPARRPDRHCDEALAVARVGHGGLHHEDVVGREVGQREASVVELAGIEITAVEADRRQRDRVELDEGRRSRFATTESNRRDRSELLSTGRQVEGNLHRGDLEETGPGDRLVTSQGRHGADPRTRPVSRGGSRSPCPRARDPLAHRRVGRHQPRDVLCPEGVGDHHVADATDLAGGREGARAVPTSSLHSAEARASGSPVSLAPSSSASYSRVRLMASWMTIAAKGARIAIASSATGCHRRPHGCCCRRRTSSRTASARP